MATVLACSLAGPESLGQNGSASFSLSTVVIDPGHGGKDPGCTSPSGKTLEKTVVLDISKRLRRKIQEGFPQMSVLMTRDDDTFVGLQERADFANSNGGNLFISIHLNSVEGKRSAPNGYSVHILGQFTSKKKDLYAGYMDVVSRENSVIMLEDDYSTRYEGFDPSDPESYIFMNLMQNSFLEQSLKFAQIVDEELKGGAIAASRGVSQDPFWVLWRTAMPSVLVECGFMSNPDDRGALITEEGRERIASDLYDAFRIFKKGYDGSESRSVSTDKGRSTSASEAKEQATEPVVTIKERSDGTGTDMGGKYYGTQVLATSKVMGEKDPFFKGWKPRSVEAGKLRKYIIGCSADLEEARKTFRSLRAKFPDSFLVVVEDGKTSIVK